MADNESQPLTLRLDLSSSQRRMVKLSHQRIRDIHARAAEEERVIESAMAKAILEDHDGESRAFFAAVFGEATPNVAVESIGPSLADPSYIVFRALQSPAKSVAGQ